MKAINKVLDIVPVQQTGSNCKTIAITALDQYYSDKLGFPSLLLHKSYQGAGLVSMRQIAKKFGSLQGELLEVNLMKDILTDIGYEPEIEDCKTIDSFREQIVDSLEKDNPLITFFAVSVEGDHTRGLPTRFNGFNEHAAVIMGFDSKTDQVTIMHWGQYFTCPLIDLFKSANSLPEQRDQEIYKPAKFEDPMRKYQILTGEEAAKEFYPETLKKSIAPRPDTGFKNKLIKLKKSPESKQISQHRKELLTKQINLDYIVKRIVKLSPDNKESVAIEEGAKYKNCMTQAIEIFLNGHDELKLRESFKNAGQTFLSRIFADGIDVSRSENIKKLLEKVDKQIIAQLTGHFDQEIKASKDTISEFKQEQELDLYIIANSTKNVEKFYILDEEDGTIDNFSNILRVKSAAVTDKSGKFKKIEILEMNDTIFRFTRLSATKIHFIFDNIDETLIENNEKIKNLISKIHEKSIPYSFENMSEAAMAKIKLLFTKVHENSIIFKEKLDCIVKKYNDALELKSSDEKQDTSSEAPAKRIIMLCEQNAALYKWDMQKLDDMLRRLSADLHQTLPPELRLHHKVETSVNLKQDNVIKILEGFKEKLAEDDNYPIPSIRQSILDSLIIDTEGHCRAICGYRSYYIALEKQINPDAPLEDIIKKVEAREITLLQAMKDYRNEKTITREQHEEINSYIFAVATTQQYSIKFVNGEFYPISSGSYRHSDTITDTQNRHLELITPKSSKSILSDIKSIFIELMEKKEDGNFIIYNSFNLHQTFFMLSKKGDSFEVIFNDPNLPKYITYDLTDKNWLDQLIKQVETAHPQQKIKGYNGFYVTQLSLPGKAPTDEHNRSELAWHAEQGNVKQFNDLLTDEALSIKDKREFTPLLCAVNGGHSEIVKIILDQKYADKDMDIHNAILKAIEENHPQIVACLAENINSETASQGLHILHKNTHFSINRDPTILDILLQNGAKISVADSAGHTFLSSFLSSLYFSTANDLKLWNHLLECKDAGKAICLRSPDGSTILMDLIKAGINEPGLKADFLKETLKFCKKTGVLEDILTQRDNSGKSVFDIARDRDEVDLLKVLNEVNSKSTPSNWSSCFNSCFRSSSKQLEKDAGETPQLGPT